MYFSIEDRDIVDLYEEVIPLCDGLLFASNRLFGIIVDYNGNQVVPGKYRKVFTIDGSEFAVSRLNSSYYIVIDKDGNQILPGEYAIVKLMGKGLYAISNYHDYQIVDRTGKSISDDYYESVKSLGNGLTECKLTSGLSSFKFAFNGIPVIFENGKEIAKLESGSLYSIPGSKETYAYQPNNSEDNYLIVDKTGKQVVPGTYCKVLSFDGKRYVVLTLDDPYRTGYTYKLIDENGVEIPLDKHHGKIVPLGNDVFALGSGKSKIVDINGNEVFPGEYLQTKRLDGKLFALQNDHSFSYKVFDRQGKQIMPHVYQNVTYLGPNLYSLKSNFDSTIVDQNGNRVEGFYLNRCHINFGEERIVVSSKTREGLNSKIYEALSQIKEGLDDITMKINVAMSDIQGKDDLTPSETLNNMEKSDTNLFTR